MDGEVPANDTRYEHIAIERREQHVAVARLNRPAVLNALNAALMNELAGALEQLDEDDDIRVIVVTGNERAFAAGADITEMATASPIDMLLRQRFTQWERIRKLRKPLIAAVNGFCLGGGNELAMVCDMIVAGESARFGQPEINLGIIPGAGGTQRLTKALGKARAMELILTGRMLSASDAYDAGLVTKVVPDELCLEEALALARTIATKPPIAVQMAKDAVLKSFDLTIEQGIEYERKNFLVLFATEDRTEGMAAFLAKRRAEFTGR